MHLESQYHGVSGLNNLEDIDDASIVNVDLQPGDICIFDGRLPHGPSKPQKINIQTLKDHEAIEKCVQIRTFIPFGLMFTADDPFGGQLFLHPSQVRDSYLSGAAPSHYAFGHSNDCSGDMHRFWHSRLTHHPPGVAMSHPVGQVMLGKLSWGDPATLVSVRNILISENREQNRKELVDAMLEMLQLDKMALETQVEISKRILKDDAQI